MQAIATDVYTQYAVWSVCMSAWPWALQKGLNRLIRRLWLVLTHLGPRNHVLHGDPDPLYEGALLRVSSPLKGIVNCVIVGCVKVWALQKQLNRSRCHFGWGAADSCGPKKPLFNQVRVITTWQLQLNSPCSAVLWAVTNITVVSCCVCVSQNTNELFSLLFERIMQVECFLQPYDWSATIRHEWAKVSKESSLKSHCLTSTMYISLWDC